MEKKGEVEYWNYWLDPMHRGWTNQCRRARVAQKGGESNQTINRMELS